MEQSLPVFSEQFLKLFERKVPMVVVTLISTIGHAPQDVGCRMIVGEKGTLFGTAGGGKVEKVCIDTAVAFLANPDKVMSQAKTWNLQRDLGMTCGGEVTFFFEVVKPADAWKIAVFGAGHISQELVPMLLKLDCEVGVYDPRPEWLDRFSPSPLLKTEVCADLPPVLDALDPKTFVVIITMGHATDYPLVKYALETKSFPYLGVIGSPVKRIRINADLKASGLSLERIEQFHCPMGERFGRNTPPEIAISIAAQLIRIRDQYFKIPSNKNSIRERG
jgi:xanthine dehydrogenase accessory factor